MNSKYFLIQMKAKNLFILILIFSIILSLNAISATDVELNSTNDDNILTQQMVVEEITGTPSDSFNEPLMIDSHDETYLSENYSSIELYVGVGKNITSDGGNGSYENPFATLELACEKVSGEEKAIVNIFNGSYYLGSLLTFNTTDLTINGLDDEVIIKNLDNLAGSKQAFSITGATSKGANVNFTMNNIIMDASGWTQGAGFFTTFYHYANTVMYKDCTFRNLKKSLYGNSEFNTFFFNCTFVNCTSIFVSNFKNNGQVVYFENCQMLNVKTLFGASNGKNVTLNGIWFGSNNIPSGFLQTTGTLSKPTNYIITKYAIFSVSEKYLGNNQYEIIGTLTWNGTDDSVCESFAPMNVTLSSLTGEIQNSTMLTNGTFKVNYISNSSENTIIAKLDDASIKLSFTNLNLQVSAPNIYYGDAQKVNLTLPQEVNGTAYIKVNNKTYDVTFNDTDSVTYVIEEILNSGNYTIEAIFIDEENQVYGSNTTLLSVFKVSEYTFDSVMPKDVKVGDSKTITINLPDDATGEVVIKLGENNFTKQASKTTEIEVSGFVEGNNSITITYYGNDKYDQQSKVDTIAAEKVTAEINNETLNVETPKGTTTPSFSISLPSDATGNLTVIINGKNYTQELVNGSATVNLPELNPGNYNAIVTYSGDSKYSPITTNATVSVPKPVLAAKSFSMLYTSGAKYAVSVTLDGKAVAGKKVSFTINGKKVTATTDKNGYASVKISLPPKSKAYTVTATYLGVKVTNKVTVKSIVTANNVNVKKSAKILKIKVSLKKVNKKYLKGKTLSLKFKGKTYKAKTNKKGIATFTIKKNVLKKLKVGKKYTYKVTYGKDVVNKKITVKK